MGGMMSAPVPVPDERMLQMIAKLKLTDSDLRVLFSKFTKYDQESVYRYFSKGVAWFMKICCLMPSLPWHSKSGTIDRSEFYKSIDEKHSEFGDAVFALIDEDNSGVLDFSEYVEALGKFCVLSKEEILKFCFNVFDDDKNGTIEGQELNHLLDIMHEGEETSNMRQALKTFDFNGDGRIDFAEFKQLHAQFPSLLYPAFRIQQNMRIHTMGESWWNRKITDLLAEKAEQAAREAATAAAANGASAEELRAQREAAARAAKEKRQTQAIRIRMGCLQYHCCPCRRHLYIVDDTTAGGAGSSDDEDEETEEERAKRLKRALQASKKSKRENIVKVPRKPLTQEERLERARKRRMRDMQDRPTRKD